MPEFTPEHAAFLEALARYNATSDVKDWELRRRARALVTSLAPKPKEEWKPEDIEVFSPALCFVVGCGPWIYDIPSGFWCNTLVPSPHGIDNKDVAIAVRDSLRAARNFPPGAKP